MLGNFSDLHFHGNLCVSGLSRSRRNRKDDENKVTLKVNEVLYLDSSGVDLKCYEGGWDNVHQSEGGEFSGDVAALRWAWCITLFEGYELFRS